MAKVISQETYDDIVKENIIEFSMSVEEAKQETAQQLEAQGINLANIIKDLAINETTGRPVLNETIDRLKEISGDTDLNGDEFPKLLDILIDECGKSVPHRVVPYTFSSVISHNIGLTEGCVLHFRWLPN